MLVELRQTGSEQLLDRVELDEPPSPGRWFLHENTSFLVMQCRHRYRLHSGRYQLSSLSVGFCLQGASVVWKA